MWGKAASVALGVLMAVATLPAASADESAGRGLTLTSSGIKRVALATDRESTSGWITFRVKDAKGLARNVSECQVTSGGRRINCDAYPLRPTSYRDGDWKIQRTSDGWEIRIFVGWLEVTSSQCWSLRSSQSWGVQIGLLSQGERLLTRRTHTYQAQCDGVAAQVSGPGIMVAREGQKSVPFKVTATVLDRKYVVTSVRRCFYDVELREPTNCFTDPISSVATRTTLGWNFSRNLTYSEMDRQECRELARQQPRRQYRLTFLDESGDAVGSASHSYRLTCRR
jgi:hypothetical protein